MSGVAEEAIIRFRLGKHSIDVLFAVCKVCRTNRFVDRDHWDGRKRVFMCVNGHSGLMASISPVIG